MGAEGQGILRPEHQFREAGTSITPRVKETIGGVSDTTNRLGSYGGKGQGCRGKQWGGGSAMEEGECGAWEQ